MTSTTSATHTPPPTHPHALIKADVAVRGDGIVAQTMALALAQQSLRVALIQPASPPHTPTASHASSDIRAYALNQASRQLLTQLRAWPDLDQACPVHRIRIFDSAGEQTAAQLQFETPAQFASDTSRPPSQESAQTPPTPDALAWLVGADVLQQQLSTVIRYQQRIQSVPAAQAAAVKADLTVVCEGKDSASRAQFGVQWHSSPYPQQAVAARIQLQNPHLHTAHQWFVDGEIIALLPLADAALHEVALVWSLPNHRVAEVLALDDEAFLNTLAQRGHPSVANTLGALTGVGARRAWPLSHAKAAALSGRTDGVSWVLAGDAAHTLHPLAGQGLNLGLADVADLADVLAKRDFWRPVNDPQLLRKYERRRAAALAQVGGINDMLYHVFMQPQEAWQRLRHVAVQGLDRLSPVKQWLQKKAARI